MREQIEMSITLLVAMENRNLRSLRWVRHQFGHFAVAVKSTVRAIGVLLGKVESIFALRTDLEFFLNELRYTCRLAFDTDSVVRLAEHEQKLQKPLPAQQKIFGDASGAYQHRLRCLQ